MNLRSSVAGALVLAVVLGVAAPPVGATTPVATPEPGRKGEALVIGHRGASGYRPENTLASYRLAIEQCADFIELDLVSTRDGALVARHRNEISATTDVAEHPEFAVRRTTKVVDGVEATGWFTEDFTLAELKTLRAKERMPEVRPDSAELDGMYQIPTLQEIVGLAQRFRTCDGEPVGLYPETKHPSYFDGLGLSMEEEVVRILHDAGYRGAAAPVFIHSAEVSNLRDLDRLTDLPLVQLVKFTGRPWDLALAGDARTYPDLLTPAGLDEVATYADGIGVWKGSVIGRDTDGGLVAPSSVVADAHARGLVVHGRAFRQENRFLPADLRSDGAPNAPGDLGGELDAFIAAGVDGFFIDQPALFESEETTPVPVPSPPATAPPTTVPGPTIPPPVSTPPVVTPPSGSGGAAPVRALGVYAGSAYPDAVDQWSDWVGSDTTVAVTFLASSSWSEIEGPGWILDPWSSWVQPNSGRRISLSVPMLAGPNADDAAVAAELRRGAGGEFDTHFRRLAENMVSKGLGNSILRIGWEMNGSWMHFRSDPDPAAWIGYFRRIVTTMRAVPGAHFLIDFNPNRGGDWQSVYPGDDVVDIIGLDTYDQSWTHYQNNGLIPGHSYEQAWDEFVFQQGGLNDHAAFAAAHGKPISFPEWALFVRPDGHGGGDNPLFIRKMREWIDGHNVAYHAYFEFDAPDGGHVLASSGTRFPNGAAEFQRQFG